MAKKPTLAHHLIPLDLRRSHNALHITPYPPHQSLYPTIIIIQSTSASHVQGYLGYWSPTRLRSAFPFLFTYFGYPLPPSRLHAQDILIQLYRRVHLMDAYRHRYSYLGIVGSAGRVQPRLSSTSTFLIFTFCYQCFTIASQLLSYPAFLVSVR